jgi:cation transport ATPase
MSTFEGPMMSIRAVNGLAHYTSGDHPSVAERIAKEVGLDDVTAGIPGDRKPGHVRELRSPSAS